jgi:hypothetical protein
MYFDRLKDIQTHAKKELFETCLAAEENARIRPNESVINARKALEIFVASVLADNGITIPSNRYEKQRQGLSNLYEQIRKCRNEYYIDQKNFILLDEIRREANEIVHITYNDAGNPEKYEIKNIDADIKLASRLVKNLYEGVINHFIKGKERLELDMERLPFGEYQIVELIKKTEMEASAGSYNYICKRVYLDETNRKHYRWVYIRAFKKEPETYYRRDSTVLYEVWEGIHELPRNVVMGSAIDTSRECDLTYIKYNISENTFTLANREKLGTVTAKTALEIIEKLINALISIQTVKAGTKIYHRGIRPEYVFITPQNDSFSVSLGCFETSKIEKDNKDEAYTTVYHTMKEKQALNPFAPYEIRNKMIQNRDDVDWEKVDTYSLGVMLLWILGDDIRPDKENDIDILIDYYSDDLLEFMEQVFYNSLNLKPSLKEFLKALKKELILIGK